MTVSTRPFGTFGLVVRLAAVPLFAYLYMESPTAFSSAPAYALPWEDGLFAAIFIALVIFGLSFLAKTGGPSVNKVVNTGLTVLLAIPVIPLSLWLIVMFIVRALVGT